MQQQQFRARSLIKGSPSVNSISIQVHLYLSFGKETGDNKFILSTNGYVFIHILLYTVLHKHSYLITTLIYCCVILLCSQSPAHCLYLSSLW